LGEIETPYKGGSKDKAVFQTQDIKFALRLLSKTPTTTTSVG
jgi:hypothetical protein